MTMTNENFDLLITALRSGDYLQGVGKLCSVLTWEPDTDQPIEFGHCCLGVYCAERGVDLDQRAWNPQREEIRSLAGFGGVETTEFDAVPALYDVLSDFTEEQRTTLARMNDNHQPFTKIADYLVEHRAEFVGTEA